MILWRIWIDVEVFNNLQQASLLTKMESDEDAVFDYARAIETNPLFSEAYFNRDGLYPII